MKTNQEPTNNDNLSQKQPDPSQSKLPQPLTVKRQQIQRTPILSKQSQSIKNLTRIQFIFRMIANHADGVFLITPKADLLTSSEHYTSQNPSFDNKQQTFESSSSQFLVPQLIKQYSMMLIKYEEDQNFFQHFVENKFIATLMKNMKASKFSSEIVKATFESLELLLRGLKREDQYVYLMVSISREGFVDDRNYSFVEEQDMAYYANFLKILARKINEDQKYLSVFLNSRQPDFPLLKNLLKFHKSPDIILHTSAKLTILQLCSNKTRNQMLQKYILNFPFAIFFPSYAYPILQSFQSLVRLSLIQNLSGNDLYEMELQEQSLRNHLKFMEDFLSTIVEREFVDMYANSFFALVGRKVYRLMLDKTQIHRVLKTIYKVVLKEVSILKIRIGIREMLEKLLTSKMEKYLKGKTAHLDPNYWLLSECQESVRQHCRAIFHNDIKMAKWSIMRTVNSYIPKSRSYWFYQQLRKVSEIIGVWIEVDKPLNHDIQNQTSYLSAMDSTHNNQSVLNPVYSLLVKPEKEQTLFWYLKISKQLHVSLMIVDCLPQLKVCTSLMLVKAFYDYVSSEDLRAVGEEETAQIKQLYNEVGQKLISFIIKEGWMVFRNRAKSAFQGYGSNIEKENQEWMHDAFRDTQCDIIFFAGLRHLLGTSNAVCQLPDKELLQAKDFISPGQVKAPCKMTNAQGNNIMLELDGQYLRIYSEEDQKMLQSEINLKQFRFQNDGQGEDQARSRTITLVDKIPERGIAITLYFLEEAVLGYMVREFTKRKQADAQIGFYLKSFKFQMNQMIMYP